MRDVRGDGWEGVLTVSALPIPVSRIETSTFKGWTVAPVSLPSLRSVLPFSPKLLLSSPHLLATCFKLRAPALPSSPTAPLCPHLHPPCPSLLRRWDCPGQDSIAAGGERRGSGGRHHASSVLWTRGSWLSFGVCFLQVAVSILCFVSLSCLFKKNTTTAPSLLRSLFPLELGWAGGGALAQAVPPLGITLALCILSLRSLPEGPPPSQLPVYSHCPSPAYFPFWQGGRV